MAKGVCLTHLTPVGIIAGISSGVQGLVGAVLSICAICTYFCALGSYSIAGATEYLTFLFQGNRCQSNLQSTLRASDPKTSAQTLVIWMFLSLFFNLVLHVVSVCLVLALWKWKKEKTIYVVNTWTFFSILTCIDDLLLTYVFADVYFGFQTSPALQSFTTLVVVFFMTRGVFCWLVNLAFIGFMINASTDLMKDLKRTKKQESSQLELINSWPSLNTIQNGHASIDRRSSTLPPGLTGAYSERPAYVRTPSMYGSQYPEHSALARWPSLAFNATAQTMKEPSNRKLVRPAIDQQRQSKSLREYGFSNSNFSPSLPLQYVRRNRSSPDGNDNQGFQGSQELRDRFIRLQSDSGSEPYDPEIPNDQQEGYPPAVPPPPNKSDLYGTDFIMDPKLDGKKFETNTMRPQSLHEAILTRPPLKPVTARFRKNSSSNV